MEIVGIAGRTVGIFSLVEMVQNWLDKRFKKLDSKMKKHDKADKRRAREIASLRADTSDSLLALEHKMDQHIDRLDQKIDRILERAA